MSARVGKGVAPAIVIAGALIGMGLFFGLRSREGAAPPATAKPAAPSTPPTSLNTERFAAAALEYHRPELVKRCWEPAPNDAPSQAKMRIDLTFGPDGSQVA